MAHLHGHPCLSCARAIGQSGIAKVITIKGGYIGNGEGERYLRTNKVVIEEVDMPVFRPDQNPVDSGVR